MRVVQISDLHLLTTTPAEDARTYRYLADSKTEWSCDTAATLEVVLTAIDRLCPAADALVITGDIAQDEQYETYVMLRGMLKRHGYLQPGSPTRVLMVRPWHGGRVLL